MSELNSPGGGGLVVQVVSTQTGAVATGTGIIPVDDTKPQNTEGTGFMTLAVTPKSASNRLLVLVTIMLASSAGDDRMVVALFKDAVVDALAVMSESFTLNANHPHSINLTFEMVAGTLDEITFKVRAGFRVASTTTFNGASGIRQFTGVYASTITIMESKP